MLKMNLQLFAHKKGVGSTKNGNMTVSAFTGLYKYFCSICKHYTAPPVGVECEDPQ